ncbi:MAG: CHAT domain-containing protein [bacterium]|nr:CHAT domain-containing protein [bacterium]
MIEKLARLSRISKSSSKAAAKTDDLSRRIRNIENKLYNLIFQPVDRYLKQYGAVNLLVSLDGVLRYIPLTSLWDGENYLVQQYRFVLLTPSNLKHIDEKPVIKNTILGMGASKGGKGFKPLPFVGKEIHAIVNDREKGCKGLIKGNALIDNDFTKKNMTDRLKTTSYPLVHIASHFKFSPGNETNNQLLLGDDTTISLSDIRKEGKLFNNVKLLVLSACQTGMGGNGEEIDGFGRLAQQCGAESVIASLWAVDDESTKELMVKFYSILKKGKVSSKIEALRQAQLHLAGLEDMINESKSNAAPSKSSEEKSDYTNPHYWAPFIMMMDNWR